MATVSKWTPFGVALDITATGGTVTRTSATKFTVKINASWETYYSGAATKYGMTASSGGSSVTLKTFSNTAASSGSGSFTGTYSISGNGSATKSITVTFRNFNDDNGDSATKSVSFNVTVPAWTSYTVSYNANGGSGAPGNQTKWKDQTLTLSSTKPTKTGHSFLGWSTSSSATSATYSAGGSYTANSAATLYAVWKANTYTVKYNANGGSGAPGNQTKTYGKTLTLSSTKPTRTNYNFKGWGTSASATTVSYAAGASYTANAAITLYAIWELAYTKPRITEFTMTRSDSSGTANEEGTNALISFKWACDKTVSSITIKWKLSSSSTWTSSTVTASGTSGTVSKVVGSNGLGVEHSYDFTITVTDANGSSYMNGTLTSMIFAFDAMAGGKGASVGKTAEEEGVFDIAYQTKLRGGLAPIVLPIETDLNNVLTPNIYAGENISTYNYSNCPLTTGTFSLEVVAQGPGGQIRQIISQCNKTTPLTYERTYYTSAWGEWQLRTPPYDSGWINLTLGSEFEQYGTGNAVRYRKIGNIVEVRGIVKPVASIAGGTDMHTIATLPSGARPVEPLYAICQGSSNCTWLFRVNNTGTLDFSRYRNGGETATAGAGTWLPFQMTFFIN
jgi:uncharacterized repeat protein (TIGR02543 family)